DAAPDCGDSRIEGNAAMLIKLRACIRGLQAPTLRYVLFCEQRSCPDTGAYANAPHIGSQLCHVGKLRSAAIPRPRCCVGLPAIVDHHERPVGLGCRRPRGDAFRIAPDIVGGTLSIRVVPVVPAIDRTCRHPAPLAQCAAKLASGVEWAYVPIRCLDDGCGD